MSGYVVVHPPHIHHNRSLVGVRAGPAVGLGTMSQDLAWLEEGLAAAHGALQQQVSDRKRAACHLRLLSSELSGAEECAAGVANAAEVVMAARLDAAERRFDAERRILASELAASEKRCVRLIYRLHAAVCSPPACESATLAAVQTIPPAKTSESRGSIVGESIGIAPGHDFIGAQPETAEKKAADSQGEHFARLEDALREQATNALRAREQHERATAQQEELRARVAALEENARRVVAPRMQQETHADPTLEPARHLGLQPEHAAPTSYSGCVTDAACAAPPAVPAVLAPAHLPAPAHGGLSPCSRRTNSRVRLGSPMHAGADAVASTRVAGVHDSEQPLEEEHLHVSGPLGVDWRAEHSRQAARDVLTGGLQQQVDALHEGRNHIVAKRRARICALRENAVPRESSASCIGDRGLRPSNMRSE